MGTFKNDAALAARAIELYNDGMPVYKIAVEIHKAKTWVKPIIEEEIAAGRLKRQRAIRESHNMTPAEMLENELLYAKICDLWRAGWTYGEIQTEVGHCFDTVRKLIQKAVQRGDVYPVNHDVRKAAVKKHNSEINKSRVYKSNKREFIEVPSTLEPGETVICNIKTSATCVYGTLYKNEQAQHCRYFEITGKPRFCGGGCSVNACNKYSKVSKTNKRIKLRGEFSISY